MLNRFQTACEQTFLFVDAMGAAASIGKSHLYASRADIRRKLKGMQWGALLPADRGGHLEHWCNGAAPEPAEMVERIRNSTGWDVSASCDEPVGNSVRISLPNGRDAHGYPFYITGPAHIMPGQLAYEAANKAKECCGMGDACATIGRAPKLKNAKPVLDPAQHLHDWSEGADTIHVAATQRMPVILDGRSLGAHMDTTRRGIGTTLTRRIGSTVTVCQRISQLPTGLDATLRLLTGKAVPGATFGSECTNVNAASTRKLRTAISTAIVGNNYSNSSPEIVLNAAPRAILDPELKILDLRVTALRRGIHKNIRRGPTTQSCVQELLVHYANQGEYMVGGADALSHARPAPPQRAETAKDGE